MNTEAKAVAESTLAWQAPAPAAISTAQRMYWAVRREFWESRSIYLAPLSIAALFLFGFAIRVVRLPAQMQAAAALDPIRQREAIVMPYNIAAAVLMLTAMIVGVFYCLDALYGERRDRSILFWKSLPVSDAMTVFSKAAIPLAVIPLLTFAITVVLQLIMLLLSSAVLAASGLRVATLWTELSFPRMSLLLLYHLETAHALWPAPIYGWLLLVSAWARRATFLWAALPLVAIAGVEKIAFNSSHFTAMLGRRFLGDAPTVVLNRPDIFPMDPMTHITPARFLGAPGLWIGLAITAAFLFAAVRLRRSQAPV